MDETGTVLFVIGIAVFMVIFFWIQSLLGKQRTESFRKVAERYGGRVIAGGVMSMPRLDLQHQGADACVEIFSTGGKRRRHYTQFIIDWPDRSFRCVVFPERLLSQLGKFLGMQDIEIGSDDFDRRYIIHSNSTSQVRDLLTAEVQHQIVVLERSLHFNDLYLCIQGGRMLVKKRGLYADTQNLTQFIEMCLTLYDAFTRAPCDGISFLESAKHTDREIVCQICGDPIHNNAAHCQACKTPHHVDCWQFYGKCSTFGCDSLSHRIGSVRSLN